jgi:hypothetical protein
MRTVIKNSAQHLCAVISANQKSKTKNRNSPKTPFFKAVQRLSKKNSWTEFFRLRSLSPSVSDFNSKCPNPPKTPEI